MSERETIDFLAGVALLEGREEADLMALAQMMRRRTVQAGEVLWRQGDDAREMVFVVDGAVSASLHLPGDRSVEIGRAGQGDVVGEIGMLDGGGHTMSARVTETTTVLALGRADFVALLAGRQSSAFALRRRLAALSTARLRNQLQHLAQSLDGRALAPPAENAERSLAELEECAPPDSRYVRRMAAFHDFEPVALWGFLTSGRYVRCPPGRVPRPGYRSIAWAARAEKH